MTIGTAYYRIFMLAGEAASAGGDYDEIMRNLQFIYKVDVSSAQSDVQLLELFEKAQPQWKKL